MLMIRHLFIRMISTSLICLHLSAGSQADSKQNLAEPGKWDPTYINTSATADEVKAYKTAFDVNMATVGYLYALPAFLDYSQRYAFLKNFRQYMGDQGNPFGQFLLMRSPASPEALDVMPNYDTLYGVAFLELKNLPMVLKVPDIPGRYYSFAFVDAYFYNFYYVGSRTTGQKAGRYLIVGPDWHGETPEGITQTIHGPTNTIHIYERIYFRNRQDVPAVNAVQDKIRLVPLATFLAPNTAVKMPDPSEYMTIDPSHATDPLQVLEIANRHMGENPPPVEDRTLIDYFAPVGVGPGLKIPDDAYSRQVLGEGAVAADHAITALALSGFVVKNGWQIPPASVGKRGGAGGMANHAMIQLRSIGINASAEAVYYIAYTDGALQPLNTARPYTLKFTKGEVPPIDQEKYGFWSLTMYDRANLRLVSNPSDKYSVRSGDDLVYGSDGSLTIYIQPEPPADKSLLANWLPTPRQGEFVLALRVYLGGSSVVSGTYVPPPVLPVQ
jgi:hypothetical protein